MNLPRLLTVKQSLASHSIADVASAVQEQLASEPAIGRIRPGDRVAIAIGSRGINRIDQIAGAIVAHLKRMDAVPFVVPAMGSHGGATAEGQRQTLAALGVTPQSVGCPIESSMDTVPLGSTDSGLQIHFDKNAASADHLIVVNRIKPHTRLTGPIQSGLCKMLMIGLGKHRGALAFHPAFDSMGYRLDSITGQVIPMIVRQTPLLLGIGLIEDAFDQIGKIEVVPADELLRREPELFQIAERWMPKLPFPTAELLIVDAIGKEISGTGLDTNVVGRKWHDKLAGPDEWPKIDQIYVRSLTAKTAGNASGIGIAEYTHRRVVEQIDTEKTRINCITAGHPTAAATPVWFDSDREVLDAVCTQAPKPAEQRRWMRITNTLDLATIRCSESYLEEIRGREDLEIIAPADEMRFDDHGNFAASARPG